MISKVSGKSADITHEAKSRIADPCRSPPIKPVISTGIASTAKYRALLITTAFVNGIARVILPILVSSSAARVIPTATPTNGPSIEKYPVSIYSQNRPTTPYVRLNNANVRIRKTDLLLRGMSVYL